MSQERLAEACSKQRLPVSVSSIKRAEAEKNILYRTLVNLASFFKVSVDYLLNTPPLSLWTYTRSQAHYFQPCIGRDWELEQISLLYTKVIHSNQAATVCITGMFGIGKTSLIHTFLAQTQDIKTKYVYSTSKKGIFELNPLQHLIRLLLGGPVNTNDSFLRDKAKKCAISQLSFFFILSLAGAKLKETEKMALNSLSKKLKNELEKIMIKCLIARCIDNHITVISIDDLQCADDDYIHFIKILSRECQHYPLLLLLGMRDVAQFTHSPQWLEYSHKIKLRPLHPEHSVSLANIFLSRQELCHVKYQDRKKSALDRAQGHPGILEELLLSIQPEVCVPEKLYQMVQKTIYSFTPDLFYTLKLSAFYRKEMNVDNIHIYISKEFITNKLGQLHTLACSGLIKQVANEYCFSHPLIWEVIMNYMPLLEKALFVSCEASK
ncbi:helix-turn-helix domain-containing protein [uncultured Shewanella sp.]|uniref:helix-turn-helix domain-containing protein n=1 Tax=uncultured Shewanella sp. TaxID=173975 RepID=UPI002622E7A7|nr:ATP-binding protein [uncultured Shewanella sp.]